MGKNILILGGTGEALEIARQHHLAGHNVTTSLAGRTEHPSLSHGQVRIGGFGGAPGLTDYLIQKKIDVLIDATHPFATRISANAREAAAKANVKLESIDRPVWQKKTGDRWLHATSIEEAVTMIPSEATAFLALGSQHIQPFASRDDVNFVVRMVDPPKSPLPFKNCQILIGKPGADFQSEQKTLKEHAITHLVCRNSGGTASYSKIEAARLLGLDVIMIGRPADDGAAEAL